MELAKAMNQTLTYFVEEDIVEMSSLQLANGLLQMKTLFQQMQIGDQLAKCLDTCPLVEVLGFSPGLGHCTFEVWNYLFEFYFDFLGLQQYCLFKMYTITRE